MVLRPLAFVALAAPALAALCARPAVAGSGAFDAIPHLAIGLSGGTLGVGLEASIKLTQFMVLRLEGSGFSWDADGTSSGIGYDWDGDIKSAGLIVDLHPFGNGFRLSGGARYLNVEFNGEATYTASYRIGDNSYLSAEIGGLSATHKVDKLAPYAGVGFDSAHFGSGFAIGLDLGLIYLGDTSATITSDRSVAGLADDLAAEAAALKDSAWYRQVYPVATMSLKYRF